MFGPVFEYEMVVMPRRLRYYATRAGYGLLMLFAFWGCYAGTFDQHGNWTLYQSARFSFAFFISFSILQSAAAILVTCSLCAGTISVERQRRTIEFLFVTDLTNWELIAGKLFARLLSVAVLLSASLPILFLSMFFGGVSSNLVLQMFVICLFTMLLSASLSICISVWTAKPRDAVIRAFVLLLGLNLLPGCLFPMRFLISRFFFLVEPILTLLSDLSPLMFLMNSMGTPMGIGPTEGWLGVFQITWKQLFVSAVMIALAVWKVRRVHLTDRVKPQPVVDPSLWATPSRWRPDVGEFPMIWKEFFGERGIRDMGPIGRVVLLFMFVCLLTPILLVYVWTVLGWNERDSFHYFAAVMGAAVGTGYVMVLSVRSAASVSIERESQTWEVLMSTPLPAWQIVIGKTVGSIYAFRAVFALLIGLWLLVATLKPMGFLDGLAVILATLLLAVFFSGAGVLLSLMTRSSNRAMYLSLLVSATLAGMYLLPVSMISSPVGDRGSFLCVPYLLHGLGVASVDVDHFHHSRTVMILGIFVYLLMTVAVLAVAIIRFDHWSGRSHFPDAKRPGNVPVPVLEPVIASDAVC